MLEVRDLDFDYPDKRVLKGIELTVNPGCLLHLRGGNGAGKTTLLKLLAGLLYPVQGDILFRGESIRIDIGAYQQNICYVGHKSGVSQLLTVRENCRFELHRGLTTLSFDELITSYALDGLEDTPCGLLSVGQRRRVGLLRLLMTEAPLWFLDEPLVALDQVAMELLMNSLDHHLNCGGLVVLTSHQKLPLRHENYQEYFL